MMRSGRFRVLRSFWLHGEQMRPGREFALDDLALIQDLLGAGKAEAADAETQRRLVVRNLVRWELVPERTWHVR